MEVGDHFEEVVTAAGDVVASIGEGQIDIWVMRGVGLKGVILILFVVIRLVVVWVEFVFRVAFFLFHNGLSVGLMLRGWSFFLSALRRNFLLGLLLLELFICNDLLLCLFRAHLKVQLWGLLFKRYLFLFYLDFWAAGFLYFLLFLRLYLF